MYYRNSNVRVVDRLLGVGWRQEPVFQSQLAYDEARKVSLGK